MAIRTITTITCDICTEELSTIHKNNKQAITIIFETEQTEGKSCKPYITSAALDICNTCEEVVLSGKMIFGSGAQGHNKYYFKE